MANKMETKTLNMVAEWLDDQDYDALSYQCAIEEFEDALADININTAAELQKRIKGLVFVCRGCSVFTLTENESPFDSMCEGCYGDQSPDGPDAEARVRY